jgi:lipid-A-disaccharide synthase
MVNLIAGNEVVPELIQQEFTADNVLDHMGQIISDGPARESMLKGFTEVKDKLRGDSQTHPADRAAQIALSQVT